MSQIEEHKILRNQRTIQLMILVIVFRRNDSYILIPMSIQFEDLPNPADRTHATRPILILISYSALRTYQLVHLLSQICNSFDL